MSRILHSRIFRCLVCLFLISCILVNLSPLKAEATAAGGAAIIKASTVTCNPAVVAGAVLIALGVWAGTNPDEFRNLVNNAVSFLETAGGWIADGSMELLRTVSEAGTYGYYVTADFLETMRSWLFDEGVVSCTSLATTYDAGELAGLYTYNQPVTYYEWNTGKIYSYNISLVHYCFVVGTVPSKVLSFTIDGVTTSVQNKVTIDGNEYYVHYVSAGARSNWDLGYGTVDAAFAASGLSGLLYYGTEPSSLSDVLGLNDSSISTTLDLTLGYVPEAAIDLGFDDDEAAAYNRSQLRVIEGGGSDPDDDNDPVIYFPIIPGDYSEIEEMTQEDQWNGTAPEEFPDSTTTEEFEIIDQPEIDGYQGIEIEPVIDPDTGTDTDPDTDPTTAPGSGSDPDMDPDSNPDSDPDSNPDSGDTSGSASWQPPSDHTQFALTDLTKFFPFCIPFDLFDFFTLLDADPVAPVFSWELQDLSGQTYSIVIDLSEWDSVALLFRRLQLFLFITGLAAASRKYIKW